MGGAIEKQVGQKVGNALKRVLSQVNIEEVASKFAPKLLPGMLARTGIAQQLGLDEAGIASLFTQVTTAQPGEEEDMYVPPGGFRKLIRLIHNGGVTTEQMADAACRVILNEDFDSVSENFGDILFLALMQELAEKEEKKAQGRKDAIDATEPNNPA